MDEQKGIKDVIEQDIWGTIKEFLNYELMHVGSKDGPVVFTVGLLLLFILSLIMANIVLKGIRILITRNMDNEDRQKFISIFVFIRYFVYLIIFLLILTAAGVNIIVLLTASAALFVGLGLALREIFQDLIGGISIITDKSLHVGDIIEVDQKVGRVIEINLRTTRALTRDDKIIVIPNHKFISDITFNYTQNHKNTRELVEVRVPLESDIRQIEKILLECAQKEPAIMTSPEPFVLLEKFEQTALLFGIYFFINDSFVEPKIKSRLRFLIYDSFKSSGIRIPYPQQDVHLYKPNQNEQ